MVSPLPPEIPAIAAFHGYEPSTIEALYLDNPQRYDDLAALYHTHIMRLEMQEQANAESAVPGEGVREDVPETTPLNKIAGVVHFILIVVAVCAAVLALVKGLGWK